jgi:hypothetical protein
MADIRWETDHWFAPVKDGDGGWDVCAWCGMSDEHECHRATPSGFAVAFKLLFIGTDKYGCDHMHVTMPIAALRMSAEGALEEDA